MTNRVLRRRDVEALTGLGRATIYRHLRAGNAPRPIRLAERLVGWLERDIEAWLASRARG
ncbi:MAG: helix-turn-helix transcriptional regulator [Rhodosalinus sp.]|uniref:helix-turn-helix transcriptional regulator n=1 Tax=Rhodosalinus sp. TaxID=2047741 RepID=UPI0039798861